MTDTVRLPEHLGERGVAVIRPGGRRGAGRGGEGGEGLGRERKGLTKLRRDRRVTGKGLQGGVTRGRVFRYKAVHKLAGKLSQQQSLFSDYQAVCHKTSLLSKVTTEQAQLFD